MSLRLQFPTLFDTLPQATMTVPTHETTLPAWRVRRGIAVVFGLVLAFGALTGCESAAPHALLDPEADVLETALQPVSDSAAAPASRETSPPRADALRMPFALQGYGG